MSATCRIMINVKRIFLLTNKENCKLQNNWKYTGIASFVPGIHLIGRAYKYKKRKMK